MTNWMTAAGIALIAGGLATLIGFRRALWAGNGRRRRARAPQAIEPSKRSARAPETPRRAEPAAAPVRIRTILPAQAGAPDISGAQQAADIMAELAASREPDAEPAASREAQAELAAYREAEPRVEERASRRGRRRRPAEERQRVAERRRPIEDDDEWSGLAEIGLADDEAEDERRPAEGQVSEPEDMARDGESADGFDEYVDATWAAGNDPAEPIDADEPGDPVADQDPDEPQHRRLARGVLARADAGTGEGARFDLASGRLVRPGDPEPEIGEPGRKARPGPNRPDRVDGWVRPRYVEAAESPAGDYWTPVPQGAFADMDETGAYGWPVPVERLPAAPAYPPPASGFDPIEESEPTAVVPQWPPARPSDRIEHPRTWSVRRGDDATATQVGRRDENGTTQVRRRDDSGTTQVRRRDDNGATQNGRDGWRHVNGPEVPKRRPRPRPNPAAEARSTVYVSRHAAEPS